MQDIQTYSNETLGATIRATIGDSGNTEFCARDAAVALGYLDPTNAVKLHCKGAAIYHPLQTPGGTQNVRFITEPDLYRLIVGSKLPSAQK